MKCRHVEKKVKMHGVRKMLSQRRKLRVQVRDIFSCSNICSGNTFDQHSFYSVLRGPCRNL